HDRRRTSGRGGIRGDRRCGPWRRPLRATGVDLQSNCAQYALEARSRQRTATSMTADFPDRALELRSLVTSQGTLELSLHDVPVPSPGANEVLVRVEASPINPSDLALLIAGADMATATVAGTEERPVVTASLGADALAGLSARVDKPLAV